ncbi:recombinase family protein [Bacillus kwashiorkori]|uniref:recombinase family protein n=1 Tax=Bacillus kwashiorkori TaxID=1522318 RepID=UPI00078267A3|nr:recombinase family protein [Bacillus kwashiorkori]
MKYFAYVRTSNGKNKEDSLQKQTGIIEDFIVQNNWYLDSVYADIGLGSNINKNFIKMIEDAQQEKIDAIIVSDPSRISRNSDYLSFIIEKLREEYKIRIITVDYGVNTFLHNNLREL